MGLNDVITISARDSAAILDATQGADHQGVPHEIRPPERP
jgi:hypothetical protein